MVSIDHSSTTCVRVGASGGAGFFARFAASRSLRAASPRSWKMATWFVSSSNTLGRRPRDTSPARLSRSMLFVTAAAATADAAAADFGCASFVSRCTEDEAGGGGTCAGAGVAGDRLASAPNCLASSRAHFVSSRARTSSSASVAASAARCTHRSTAALSPRFHDRSAADSADATEWTSVDRTAKGALLSTI